MTRSADEILADVKLLALEYYATTKKPLGVTGEIAEAEAARLFGLTLMDARGPGYDAERRTAEGIETIQIKGRWKRGGSNWGRVPAINTRLPFDTVMLVLMTGDYSVAEVWEAPRDAVAARLDSPGSKARNERRSMGVTQFKSIARRVWP